MAKQVTILVPDSEDELAAGLKDYFESTDRLNRLIKNVDFQLAHFINQLPDIGRVYTIPLGSELIRIIRNKNSLNLINEEDGRPFTNSKLIDRFRGAQYASQVLKLLQDPSAVQDLMIYFSKNN